MEPITPPTSHNVVVRPTMAAPCCSHPPKRSSSGTWFCTPDSSPQNCTSPYLRQSWTWEEMGTHCSVLEGAGLAAVQQHRRKHALPDEAPTSEDRALWLPVHLHSPPTATSDLDDHKEPSRELPRPRGLLFPLLHLLLYRRAEKTGDTNTRPIPPISRDPDGQTRVLRLMPTRRPTPGLGTSGAAAPRNGAARRGSQISQVPGLSDRNSRLGPDDSWLPADHGLPGDRRYLLVGYTSVLRGPGNTR
ncbi:hypothetical protein QBC39DRAFT_130440 [Podospora conica]|nr:hypothetical protein QBC39DRAFT_130440 [Schizothecium conicum]